MSTETKVLGSVLLGSLLIIIGGAFFLSKSNNPSSSSTQTVEINYSQGQKIGSDSAKVKVVEFSDFQCPACLAAEPVVNILRQKYPNDVQLIYRHFPLSQHQYSKLAAIFAEAVAVDNKFWQIHDKLFDTQTEWSEQKDAKGYFLKLAEGLGLDQSQIASRLEDKALIKKVDDDLADGLRLGVNSTPTFFINGRKLNLKSYNELLTKVEQLLK